jgi:hypothetical protein
MASDMGAILAALATGGGPGKRRSADNSEGGLDNVVGITLRLIADPGNAAVVKQLGDQVSAAAHKALQEMGEFRGKVRSAATEWTASVGHVLRERWPHPASGPSYASDKLAATLQETPAGRELSPTGAHGSRRSGTTLRQPAQRMGGYDDPNGPLQKKGAQRRNDSNRPTNQAGAQLSLIGDPELLGERLLLAFQLLKSLGRHAQLLIRDISDRLLLFWSSDVWRIGSTVTYVCGRSSDLIDILRHPRVANPLLLQGLAARPELLD